MLFTLCKYKCKYSDVKLVVRVSMRLGGLDFFMYLNVYVVSYKCRKSFAVHAPRYCPSGGVAATSEEIRTDLI